MPGGPDEHNPPDSVVNPARVAYAAGMKALALALALALAPTLASADAITDLVERGKRETAERADRGLKPSDIAACRAQGLAAPGDFQRAADVELACRKARRLRNAGS